MEGFEDSPLNTLDDPAAWWTAYLRQVVPPALEAFERHGVVIEAHLQNTVVAVDPAGLPVQALFRDAEGVKLLAEVSRAAGWERLVYCLSSTTSPKWPPCWWSASRLEPLARSPRRTGPPPGARDPRLLASPTLPGKTNLLLAGRARTAGRALSAPANPLACR